jgi:hypothetical protein
LAGTYCRLRGPPTDQGDRGHDEVRKWDHSDVGRWLTTM